MTCFLFCSGGYVLLHEKRKRTVARGTRLTFFVTACRRRRRCVQREFAKDPFIMTTRLTCSRPPQLAVMCAFDLAFTLKLKRSEIAVTTFGCPKVGSFAFERRFARLVLCARRFVMVGDIITRLPIQPLACQDLTFRGWVVSIRPLRRDAPTDNDDDDPGGITLEPRSCSTPRETSSFVPPRWSASWCSAPSPPSPPTFVCPTRRVSWPGPRAAIPRPSSPPTGGS